MWDNVKNIIGSAAPMIGTIIGGPAGTAVGSLVASALGVENTSAAIEQELRSNPDALVKLKQLEFENQVELKKIAFQHAALASDERKAEILDLQNARVNHKDHWMPSLLTICLSLMVAGMFAALFILETPKQFDQVVIMITGAVLGAFGNSVSFWLGSSKGSADKSKLLKGG